MLAHKLYYAMLMPCRTQDIYLTFELLNNLKIQYLNMAMWANFMKYLIDVASAMLPPFIMPISQLGLFLIIQEANDFATC